MNSFHDLRGQTKALRKKGNKVLINYCCVPGILKTWVKQN